MNIRRKHGIHRLALLNGAKPVHHVDINPALRLTLNQVRVIRLHHVLAVLCARVRLILVDFARIISNLNHPRGLSEETPVVWLYQHLGLLSWDVIRDWNLTSHDGPPMILFRRVGIGNNASPRRTTITHRRIAANTHRAGIDNTLRNLSRFVDPDASKFERQKLLNVFRAVQSKEENLKLNVPLLDHVRVRH